MAYPPTFDLVPLAESLARLSARFAAALRACGTTGFDGASPQTPRPLRGRPSAARQRSIPWPNFWRAALASVVGTRLRTDGNGPETVTNGKLRGRVGSSYLAERGLIDQDGPGASQKPWVWPKLSV